MKPLGSCPLCIDNWNWLAIYNDGTYLYECNLSTAHYSYADIDISKLESLGWIPLRDDFQGLFITKGQWTIYTPVVFRRRFIEIQVDMVVTSRPPVHCLGWENNLDDSQSDNTYLFLLEDGNIITANDRNAV